MHSEVNCNCDYNTDAYIFIPNITAVENTELQGSPQPHNEREASLQTRNPALNKQSKLLLYYKLKGTKSAFLPHKAVVMGAGFNEHACQINGTATH